MSPYLTAFILIAAVAIVIAVAFTIRASRSAAALEHPEILQFDRFELKLARIEAGWFTMGSPRGEPGHDATELPHPVTLTKPFWMGVTTVTRQQFTRFVEDTRYKTTAEQKGRSIVHGEAGLKYASGITWRAPAGEPAAELPVVHVSDEDAVAFCKWASRRSGRAVRLPTEAEWEYACRAGTTTPFAGRIDEMGWYAGNSGDVPLDCSALARRGNAFFIKAMMDNHCRPHPVARKRPNAWGLHDMHGNVWQWCSDVYADYPPGPATDPTGPKAAKPEWRSARSGDWANSSTIARSANRGNWRPGQSYDMIGFRVVVDE